MKKNLQFHKSHLVLLASLLALGLISLVSLPARSSVATIAPRYITSDTTWTEAGSPYLVDSFVMVNPGVTLTIEAGVEVNGNYVNGDNYLFQVDGRLIAQGTAAKPIQFHNTLSNGHWSGILINGTAGNLNLGSSLEYVTVESGGAGGSGVGGNLALKYSQVDVHHCQFNNGLGDGILGDDYTAGGVANIYDSSFMNNAGYAVNFQNGAVNPVLQNLTASGNGSELAPYSGDVVFINNATLHGAHIWENMGLPYLILQTAVGTDSQLTIEPGVQVLSYPGNDALDVQGVLVAEGTVSQPIRFDPIDPALGWAGIAIVGTDILPSAEAWLDHVIITKGGFTGGDCDVYLAYGNATVTNSQLDSSAESGLCLDHGATLVMTNTQLTNNQEYAMDVIDAGSFFTLENLSASGNMSNTIGVEGGTLMGPHTWPKSGINTYDILYAGVTIAPTGTLNIEPGVSVLFAITGDITVYGELNTIGTPAEPILITGEEPTPGLWAGVNFIGTPEQPAVGHLAYTTIEYAGYGGSALVSMENANVTFTHCILRYGSSDAIRIYPGPMRADSPADSLAIQPLEVYWSSLLDIGGYAINNGSVQAVLAKYNWWGAAGGPTADDNPGGTGSGINGPVLYRPYLTAPDLTSVFLPLTLRNAQR